MNDSDGVVAVVAVVVVVDLCEARSSIIVIPRIHFYSGSRQEGTTCKFPVSIEDSRVQWHTRHW